MHNQRVRVTIRYSPVYSSVSCADLVFCTRTRTVIAASIRWSYIDFFFPQSVKWQLILPITATSESTVKQRKTLVLSMFADMFVFSEKKNDAILFNTQTHIALLQFTVFLKWFSLSPPLFQFPNSPTCLIWTLVTRLIHGTPELGRGPGWRPGPTRTNSNVIQWEHRRIKRLWSIKTQVLKGYTYIP